MRRDAFALAVLLCCAGPTGGCGGDSSFRDGVYRDEEARYRVGPLDPRWERLALEDDNDLAWRDPPTGAIIQANAGCDPALDIPLEALTMHLLIGFTERHVQYQERAPMDGREALVTQLDAKLDGVPRRLRLVVLKKNGCVYDFSLVSPPGPPFERASADFSRFVQGFSTR